jgi:hypothetical protein
MTKRTSRKRRRWTKASIVAELRSRGRRGLAFYGDTPLYNAARNHFGSLGAAARAARIEFRSPRRWSRRETLAALRELAATHGTVTYKLAIEHRVLHMARRHFRTLGAACRAASVATTNDVWRRQRAIKDDPRAMLDQLRAIARGLRRPIARRDLSWSLSEALRLHFGSLAAARDAAGVAGPRPTSKWTRDAIIRAIRAEHRKGTRITAAGLVKAGRSDLAGALRREFATIEQARRAARVAVTPHKSIHAPFVKVWDEATVIAAIEDRVVDGHSLAFSRIPNRLARAAARYFGSWRAAIEAAGMDYEEVRLHKRWDNETLLSEVRKLAVRQPNMTLGELRGTALGAALYARFGGPSAAAKRVGIVGWPVRRARPPMPVDEVRAILRARLQLRKPITRTAIIEEFPELEYSVTRVHPVWSVALARLGVDGVRRRSKAATRVP